MAGLLQRRTGLTALVAVTVLAGAVQAAQAGGGRKAVWPTGQYIGPVASAPVAGYAGAPCSGPGCAGGGVGGDIDPFCGCNIPRHPWESMKPTNGYDNQRFQHMRIWADKKRLPQPFLGDAWLERYERGSMIAPAGSIASPYQY
jgi:hypothetical protein